MAALVLFALGIGVLQTLLIAQRQVPTVSGDDFLYLARARNFAEFKSYYPPEGERDEATSAFPRYVSAPLYSLALAPAQALHDDPIARYRLMLLFNGLFLLSGVSGISPGRRP